LLFLIPGGPWNTGKSWKKQAADDRV